MVGMQLHAAAAQGGGITPATVGSPVKESQLTTVTLSPQAEQRLGVLTIAVEKKKLTRTRFYGGEVVLPVAGVEGSSGGRVAPAPPASPDAVLKLADTQLLADGEVRRAQVQLDAARIALNRAEDLRRSESGSQRVVDEARATLLVAEVTLENAEARRGLLGVAAGKAASLNRAWVRVPVYVGDLAGIVLSADARIGGLANVPGQKALVAKPVTGPPSATPGAASVDLFYEMENPGNALRLGQRVGVTLTLHAESEALVAPWAAVLHDMHGGQWVYENTGAQTYVRRRVEVARVQGADAILARGLSPGAKVVTDGAAELFGTEFGAGH
jgi:peptidoglycan hydrolase-like protein with peptidoglycan-binding domain